MMGLPEDPFDHAYAKAMCFDSEAYEETMAKKVTCIALWTGWSLDYIMEMDFLAFESFYQVAYDVMKEMNGGDASSSRTTVVTLGGQVDVNDG